MYADFDSYTLWALVKREHQERVQRAAQQALWRQYRARQSRQHQGLLWTIRRSLLTFGLWGRRTPAQVCERGPRSGQPGILTSVQNA
jgi:hypothetical protein